MGRGTSSVSKAPRVAPHRYAPRIVGNGHELYCVPACSCGWQHDGSAERGRSRELWREHRREASA